MLLTFFFPFVKKNVSVISGKSKNRALVKYIFIHSCIQFVWLFNLFNKYLNAYSMPAGIVLGAWNKVIFLMELKL